MIDDRPNPSANSSLHRVPIRQRHNPARPHDAVTPIVKRIIPKDMAKITTTIEKCPHSTVQSYPITAIDRLDPNNKYTPLWGNPHSSQYRLNR